MSNIFFKDDVLFDSHCHLCDSSFDNDRAQVVSRAKENGIEHIVDISVDMSTAKKAVENANAFTNIVYASVGIDMECLVPGSDLFSKELFLLSDNEWKSRLEEMKKELLALVRVNREQIVSIGETGLDHYWLERSANSTKPEDRVSDEDSKKSKKRQEDLFCMQLELAVVTGLPLSIHSRGAERRCLDIISRSEYEGVSGVFHSYTGSFEVAKRILDSSWGLGVNGIVTFEKAGEMREMYRKIVGRVSSDWSPADYYNMGIYFETDAPYLAPKGKRGERNEPSNLTSIYSEFIQILQ